MSSDESLQAEVEKLRSEVESHRQRELAELKSALAAAREDASHYRAEAYRINANFQNLVAMDNEKIGRLEAEIATLRQVNRRPVRANA
jgi:hypothetical protein